MRSHHYQHIITSDDDEPDDEDEHDDENDDEHDDDENDDEHDDDHDDDDDDDDDISVIIFTFITSPASAAVTMIIMTTHLLHFQSGLTRHLKRI